MTEVLYGVEGTTDVPVVEAMIAAVGCTPRRVLVARGKSKLDPRIRKWNQAGNQRPFLVLRDWDLDDDAPCIPQHVTQLLGGALLAPGLAVRVPERSVESWLLADRDGFAEHFSTRDVPVDPDRESDPKARLVDACRRSRSSAVRRDMVPRAGGRRKVGDLYEARIIAFGEGAWSLDAARSNSPSLDRAMVRLETLVADGVWRDLAP